MDIHLLEKLAILDQGKKTIVLSYRLPSGKIVNKTTVLRALVEKEGELFILTESGEPIPVSAILGLKEKK